MTPIRSENRRKGSNPSCDLEKKHNSQGASVSIYHIYKYKLDVSKGLWSAWGTHEKQDIEP